jgi:hypothetical protein
MERNNGSKDEEKLQFEQGRKGEFDAISLKLQISVY